jgi:ESS family glutamate:Na+ symporter
MTTIVYHCLALGFIALTLKQGKAKGNKKVWSTGMLITSTYALQGFIGMLLVLIFFSDKFVGSGMLLALGFGQGPGLAQSFGGMWTALLDGHGATLGVSYAVVGFLVGGTIGVLLINLLSRKKNIEKTKRYYDTSVTTHEIKVDTVKEVSVMDGLTIQIVIISIIYFLVWGTLYVLSGILTTEAGGTIGDTVYGLFEGFNFILGIFYAMLFKVILKVIQKKGKNISFVTNDYILSNLSSYFFNIMICGAVLTITFDFLSAYGVLLAVISAVGAVLTLLYLRFMTNKVYNENKDEYFVGLFGMLTGTASTGIALLKGLDRNLETPVAEELVLGSGTAIAIALPLFVFLMLPSLGYDIVDGVLIGANAKESLFLYIALFGILLYFLVVGTILLLRARTPKKVQTND